MIKITLAFVVVISCSGCGYFSQRVREIGLDQEFFETYNSTAYINVADRKIKIECPVKIGDETKYKILSWDDAKWEIGNKGRLLMIASSDKFIGGANGAGWYSRSYPICDVEPKKVGEYNSKKLSQNNFSIITADHSVDAQLYREDRRWYGYPAQILWIPSLAIDLVTSPIQFILFLNRFSGIKG